MDGLTCELAMASYLKSLGKRVYIINADRPLKMYRFLPGINIAKKFNGRSINYDVAIILDCGDLDRIGRVRELIGNNKIVINIDHHITNDRFGFCNLIKPRASSTAEIIFELFKAAGYRLTKPVALLLYLGIMTDTGSFRYDNTTPAAHAIAGGLMKFRFSTNQAYQAVYDQVPLRQMKALMRIIEGCQIMHKGKLISVTLQKKTLRKFSGEFDLNDKIFSLLRSIKGAEVIVIFTENTPRLTRVNFRSQGRMDVAKLASLYQGGGHQKASGCLIKASLKEAKRSILSRLDKMLR